MKKYLFILFIALSSVTCEKYEKMIAVKTGIFSALTATTATIEGNIIDPGNGIIEHGHCWSKTNQNPTPESCDGKSTLGSKNNYGNFTSEALNLTPGTLYYFSTYATDANGSITGKAFSFTTLQSVAATISTTAITSITTTTAASGGDITSDGSSAITARGVCWSTSSIPTVSLSTKTSDGTGTGPFTSSITGLTANTKYYVRAYATNSVGTAYGNEVNFTTLSPPTATSTAATALTTTTATLNGAVNANGQSTTVTFEYGTTTSYGSIANATPVTVTGSTVVNVNAIITGLTASTLYHFRVKAVSAGGTTYGSDLTFTTTAILAPSATTTAATSLSTTTATLNGTVNANNESTTVTFEYGLTISYGNTANANPGTVISSATTDISSNITGLTASTLYHFRIKAVSAGGTTYGTDLTFTTTAIGGTTVTDIDGNVYNTITIGTQIWTKENLKTTKYSDGEAIAYPVTDTDWANNTTGAYAWYNNDIANKTIYGALYNWHAFNTGKLCPAGWHVPTDAEWKTIEMYLGMSQAIADLTGWRGTNEGSKLAGNAALWTDGVLDANAAFGTSSFAALPGGYRHPNGPFYLIGNNVYLWSSTPIDGTYAWIRYMAYSTSFADRDYINKQHGFSVRCLKD